MTTRAQDIDALAGAIRRLIEALIAGDQRVIGSHHDVTDAQADLRAVLRRANLPPLRPASPPKRALPFYERHPKWRPRKQSRRQLRRRVISGG